MELKHLTTFLPILAVFLIFNRSASVHGLYCENTDLSEELCHPNDKHCYVSLKVFSDVKFDLISLCNN
jgi:hypothetical protein